MWGCGPTSRIRSPESYARHPKEAAHPRLPVMLSDKRSDSELLSPRRPVSRAYRQIHRFARNAFTDKPQYGQLRTPSDIWYLVSGIAI